MSEKNCIGESRENFTTWTCIYDEQDAVLSGRKMELWSYWIKNLPFLKFDSDWEVKIIPPYVDAIISFVVRKDSKQVTVYFNILKEPHWQMAGEETKFSLGQEAQLLEAIRAEVSE